MFFAIPEGSLTIADARATTDLTAFFNLTQAPRSYVAVPAALKAAFFISGQDTAYDPDDD